MELISLVKDTLQHVAETAASYKAGQTVLRHIDRTLWVIEKCAKWAVPPPLDQDDRPQPELIRPLPWVFFLMMLVTLRVVRESISLANLVMGKPPLRSADMVMYIQSKRRYLRTLKYQGNRISRARTTPVPPQVSWYSSIRALFEVTMCFRRQPMSSNNNTDDKGSDTERLVVKRSKQGREDSSPVVSAGETTMERLIEKMMVDLHADSDDDSSFTLTNVTSPKSDGSDFTIESDQETAYQNNTVQGDPSNNNKSKHEQVTNKPLDDKKNTKDVKSNNNQQTATKTNSNKNHEVTKPSDDTKTPENQNMNIQKDQTGATIQSKKDLKAKEIATVERNSEKPTIYKKKDTIKVLEKKSTRTNENINEESRTVSSKAKIDFNDDEKVTFGVTSEKKYVNAEKDIQPSKKEMPKPNNDFKAIDNTNVNTPDEVSESDATKTKNDSNANATKDSVTGEEKTTNTNDSKHATAIKVPEENPHSESQVNNIVTVTTIETEVQEFITIRNETQKSKKELSKRTKKALSTPEITPKPNQKPLESHSENNELLKEVFYAPELATTESTKEETMRFLEQETSKIPRNSAADPKLANGRTVKSSPGKKRGHMQGKDSRNAARSSSTNNM